MKRHSLATALFLFSVWGSVAPSAMAAPPVTINNQNVTERAEWVELPVTTGPAFSSDKLLPLDMPPGLAIRFGVDPQTITVDSDGVVRYVVVMRNMSGSETALYEGIRCETREVKSYARHGSSGDWVLLREPKWRAFTDPGPSTHAPVFARQAVCKDGHFLPQKEIIEALRKGMPPADRYGHVTSPN
jgi:CNP1-like family